MPDLIGTLQLCEESGVWTPEVKRQRQLLESPTSGDEPFHFSDHKRFRIAVGKLQWMAAVRPDIQYAVMELSRKLSAATG
eukprot:3214134-Amphidinium_carterae.1